MADKAHEHLETAPDPEEDNLDDLDDVLDEFQPTQSQSKPSAPAASGPGRPSTASSAAPADAATATAAAGKDAQDAADLDSDFAKQLEAGMSNLISELDSNPEMQKEFEKMMQELMAAGAAPGDKDAGEHLKKAAEAVSASSPSDDRSKAGSGSSGGGSKDDFQTKIRKTMERMQASGDAATAASGASGENMSEDDLLAAMMRELGAGGEGDGDFNSMLMNMMAQLTHKEILYEPMKELQQGFPAWLEKNRATTPKEDLDRYEEQQKLVGEIVTRFERKGYSDDNADDREYIVDKMQKMQSCGSPPADLVGDMNAAQEALGDLDNGCPTQ